MTYCSIHASRHLDDNRAIQEASALYHFRSPVTCRLLRMISSKVSDRTLRYSGASIPIRVRLIMPGVCVWCFNKWWGDAEQHRPMLWYCCCFCMGAWFNQLHGPPPLPAAVCSSALITLQIVLLMFFLCLFTMGGGRDGWGLVKRCTAVGVNCYLPSTDYKPILKQFSKLHGTKPSKDELIHRCS